MSNRPEFAKSRILSAVNHLTQHKVIGQRHPPSPRLRRAGGDTEKTVLCRNVAFISPHEYPSASSGQACGKINATTHWRNTLRGMSCQLSPLACPELVEGLILWLHGTVAEFLARVLPNENTATFTQGKAFLRERCPRLEVAAEFLLGLRQDIESKLRFFC